MYLNTQVDTLPFYNILSVLIFSTCTFKGFLLNFTYCSFHICQVKLTEYNMSF